MTDYEAAMIDLASASTVQELQTKQRVVWGLARCDGERLVVADVTRELHTAISHASMAHRKVSLGFVDWADMMRRVERLEPSP